METHLSRYNNCIKLVITGLQLFLVSKLDTTAIF
uniref:Uncharacterized protein n=1 Tax=Arundo donax TaxID=35708 RepID=A0A0A9H8V7_ARUDO